MAANTAYSKAYHQRLRTGRPVLGAHVDGTEAATIIAALIAEGFRKAHIAVWLGRRWRSHTQRPALQWQNDGCVTVRTMMKLRRILRRVSQ